MKKIEKQEVFTKEKFFIKLWSYKKSEQESYGYFMGLNTKEIQAFEIGGNKVTSLQTLSGIEVKGDVLNPSGFQEWIEKVFEGKKIEKQDKTLFSKLWSYKKSEQESYGYFMGMNAKEIQAFEIGGNKVRSLQKLSGIETTGKVQAPSGFQEWIEKVFEGKKIEKQEVFTKEKFFIKLWSYKKSEQESYGYFMGMNAKEIQAFEIGGNKVRSLQKLSGIETKGNVKTPSGFQEWIEKIFEEKKIIKK